MSNLTDMFSQLQTAVSSVDLGSLKSSNTSNVNTALETKLSQLINTVNSVDLGQLQPNVPVNTDPVIIPDITIKPPVINTVNPLSDTVGKENPGNISININTNLPYETGSNLLTETIETDQITDVVTETEEKEIIPIWAWFLIICVVAFIFINQSN